MPLPDGLAAASLPWPPPAIAPGMAKWAEWGAWWAGDPDGLSNLYGSRGTGAKVRPSQYAGGVVGGIARWFWGAPAAVGQQRAKLHLPIASDIATASADLLYSEAVKITPPEDVSVEAGARLEELLDGLSFDSFLPEQAELAAAYGGVYHRVTWDSEVAGHPLVTAVPADCAWPEFRYGRLLAVTFWDTAAVNGTTHLRILERHDRGRIETGIYEGTEDKLGRRVDFGALTGLGLPVPEVDSDSGVNTGYTDGLTATFVPNLRPVRLLSWRRHPVLSAMGRSDLDGIEPLLDAADETMTSWLRDLRLGKGRLLVPEQFLTSGGEGRGSFFNIDQEVFAGVNAAIDADKPLGDMLTQTQFDIRTAEHAATLAGILGAAFRGAGYSQQTFGIAGEAEGAATATEVNARESRSNRTREKKSRYQTDAVPATLQAVLAVDAEHFGGTGRVAGGFRVAIEFPDVTRPDQEVEARTIQALRAAQAISILTSVQRLHPDWDDDQVVEEVGRIVQDEQALTPTLPDLGALPGDETIMSAADVSEAADAMGVLIRAGVDPDDAAKRVGLPGVKFTGAVPTSLRLPSSDATSLEGP